MFLKVVWDQLKPMTNYTTKILSPECKIRNEFVYINSSQHKRAYLKQLRLRLVKVAMTIATLRNASANLGNVNFLFRK